MSSTPANSDAHLARLLGIDKAMVCRLKKRGMPTASLEAAQAWRRSNLSSSQRKDSNPARDWHQHRDGTPAAARAALQKVEELAELAHAAAVAGRFELVRVELQAAIAAVPEASRERMRLSMETWDCLLAEVMDATEPFRTPGAAEQEHLQGQASVARLLGAVAAGEDFEHAARVLA